ncbi:hypothetical protein, partial [Niastella populi]|uniref:hypothetical protein n=1 Tax=Niastella populi TaxID=550983 RepID=UPI001A993E24
TDEVVRGLIEEYGFKITKDYRIYSLINTEGKRYFINGMSFGVFHNKLDILETSLGRYDYGDLGEMIFWYSD